MKERPLPFCTGPGAADTAGVTPRPRQACRSEERREASGPGGRRSWGKKGRQKP